VTSDDPRERVAARLAAAGLDVTRREVGGRPALVVVDDGDAPGPVPVWQHAAYLWRIESKWLFRVLRHVPGPGPYDFEFRVGGDDALMEAVLRYFQGPPAEIGGWRFPGRRHPRWGADKLRRVIMGARLVGDRAWQAVADAAHGEWTKLVARQARTADPAWSGCVFAPVDPVEPVGQVLWVRHDLAEAYAVVLSCPGCQRERLSRAGWYDRTRPEYTCGSCEIASHRAGYGLRPND